MITLITAPVGELRTLIRIALRRLNEELCDEAGQNFEPSEYELEARAAVTELASRARDPLPPLDTSYPTQARDAAWY